MELDKANILDFSPIIITHYLLGSYTDLFVSIGFDEGDRLFGLAANLARQHFHFDPGSDVVLAAVDNPGDCRNDEYDCKGGDTVV